MKTTNIISTPDITGNIGTCQTNSVEALTHGGFWKNTYQVVMTNSCTGQIVKDYEYTTYSWTAMFAFAIAVFMIWATISANKSQNNNNFY